MAILIGDIGGTTSRWAIVPEGGVGLMPMELPGYNPATGDPAAMQAGLRKWEASGAPRPSEIIAYGAGCGSRERAERMRAALSEVWPTARVRVETDLLGAARGLYGTDSGLVLILGTGMNAGHYDGRHLHMPMPSLGFILGDEGSGADIGKHLLRDVLYGVLPGTLREELFPGGIDLGAVLDATYRSAAPQAYLASFTGALAKHLDVTYVQDLIAARFFALTRVLSRSFSVQELQQVRASGSVASGFQGILRDVLAERRIQLTTVVRDPLAGLVAYHAKAMR